MLEVCPRIQTQEFRRRRHWLIAASTINWSNCTTHRSDVFWTFEFIDVRYFGAVNSKIPKNIYQIFNPTKLFNHVAPSTELMMRCVSNLILTVFSIV